MRAAAMKKESKTYFPSFFSFIAAALIPHPFVSAALTRY